jgi:hypothetical protein
LDLGIDLDMAKSPERGIGFMVARLKSKSKAFR